MAAIKLFSTKSILRLTSLLAVSLVITFKLYLGYGLLIRSFQSEALCARDFVQFYLAGLALTNSPYSNPYAPLPEIALEYNLQCNPHSYLSTPTPYPPASIVILSPLSRLSLLTASIVWLCFSISFYLLSAYISWTDCFPEKRWRRFWPLVACLVLCASPVQQDLAKGNVNSVLFLLASLMTKWLNSSPRDKLSPTALLTISLGLAFKLFGWLFLPLIALRLPCSNLIRVIVYSVAINLVVLAPLSTIVASSWVESSATVSKAGYLQSSLNQSLLTIGFRVFSGMDRDSNRISTAPLIDFAPAAVPFSILILICSASLALFHGTRVRLDNAFLALATIGLFLQPVAWDHYCTIGILCLFKTGQMPISRVRTYAQISFVLVLVFWELVASKLSLVATWGPGSVNLACLLPAMTTLQLAALLLVRSETNTGNVSADGKRRGCFSKIPKATISLPSNSTAE